MGAVTVRQMVDRVAELMTERLRVRGEGLEAKLRKAGGRLPSKVRRAAEALVEADKLAAHPKTQLMIDDAKVADAYDVCVRHLKSIGAKDRATRAALGVAGSVVFALLVVAGLVIGVLVWRGYL